VPVEPAEPVEPAVFPPPSEPLQAINTQTGIKARTRDDFDMERLL
jgi:hypothetical protein